MKTNLTDKVKNLVIRKILDGSYDLGSRIPAERDMAELTNTSRITVRRAYEQLGKAGIITRVQGAGTRVSDTFKGNQDNISHIALISTLRDPFVLDFIEAVEKAVTQNDSLFILALTDSAKNETEVALRLASEGIKNIIVWGASRTINMEVFSRLRILGINVVFFDRIVPQAFADFVGLDNKHAIHSIIKDAIKQKYNSLVFIDYADIDFDSNRERKEAFIKQCKQYNVNYSLIEVPYKTGDYKAVEKKLHEKTTVQNDLKRALVCANDSIALKIIKFGYKEKVYSIDGRQEALKQGIISYSQPISKMAEATVSSLISQQTKGNSWKASSFLFKGKLLIEKGL